MNGVQAGLNFEPRGYCPRCDYRTDPGTCSECGLVIAPSKLRKGPRTWLHHHGYEVLAVLVVLIGLAFFVSTRPEIARYLPTFCLLDLQVSDGHWSGPAGEELARRYTAGTLSPASTTRFVQQWADAEWSVVLHRKAPNELWRAVRRVKGAVFRAARLRITHRRLEDGCLPFLLLRNAFVDRAFPATAKLPLFCFEESVLQLRIDGLVVPLQAGPGNTAPLSCPLEGTSSSLLADGVAEQLTVPSTPPLRRNQGFYCSALYVEPGCMDGAHEVEIRTTVKVTELGMKKVIASWPLVHCLRFDVKSDFCYAPIPRRHFMGCGRRAHTTDMVGPNVPRIYVLGQ